MATILTGDGQSFSSIRTAVNNKITEIDAALALKSATTHNHAGVYEPADGSIIKQEDVRDTPANSLIEFPISANWAYDHVSDTDAHGRLVAEDVTYTVGPSHNYDTLSAALADLTKKRPLYSSAGVTVTLQLASGFVFTEQVVVRGVNLGWIKITSVDATVPVDTTDFSQTLLSTYKPMFAAINGGVSPQVSIAMTIDTNPNIYSQFAYAFGAGSSVNIVGGGINGGSSNYIWGLYATQGGRIYADGSCSITNCLINVEARQGGHITVIGGTLTGGVSFGVRAVDGGHAVVYNSGCRKGASNSSTDIVVSNGSIVSAVDTVGGLSQTANTVTADGIIFQ